MAAESVACLPALGIFWASPLSQSLRDRSLFWDFLERTKEGDFRRSSGSIQLTILGGHPTISPFRRLRRLITTSHSSFTFHPSHFPHLAKPPLQLRLPLRLPAPQSGGPADRSRRVGFSRSRHLCRRRLHRRRQSSQSPSPRRRYPFRSSSVSPPQSTSTSSTSHPRPPTSKKALPVLRRSVRRPFTAEPGELSLGPGSSVSSQCRVDRRRRR